MAKTPKTPYTSVTDVDAFFERVQTIAEPKPPKKVDSAWVESYQFKTAHLSAIPSMLFWLGVIDEEGESTGVWNELRVDGTRQTTLARLVKEEYSAVFDSVDVENASASDLRGAFVSAYAIGDPGRHIKCFLALCRHAGIRTAEEATARSSTAEGDAKSRPKQAAPSANGKAKKKEEAPPRRREFRKLDSEASTMAITLNVEIPAEWTENQIQQRIAAVARALEAAGSGDS